MEQRYFHDKTNEFNLYLGDEDGENLCKMNGAISVELPKITFDEDGKLLGITPVRIYFASVENALAVVHAKTTHLRIRAAEQLYSTEGGYIFKPRQHIFTVDRKSMQFSPGVTERDKPAYALCEFMVKKYSMTFDGLEVLYASMEDKVLRMN